MHHHNPAYTISATSRAILSALALAIAGSAMADTFSGRLLVYPSWTHTPDATGYAVTESNLCVGNTGVSNATYTIYIGGCE